VLKKVWRKGGRNLKERRSKLLLLESVIQKLSNPIIDDNEIPDQVI
jgi:hypothetical protein